MGGGEVEKRTPVHSFSIIFYFKNVAIDFVLTKRNECGVRWERDGVKSKGGERNHCLEMAQRRVTRAHLQRRGPQDWHTFQVD